MPLLATALGLGWNTRTRIKGQLADLSRARDVADLADRSLNLILTQDVVTYAILMDPENIADAPTKIEAYDALTAALHGPSRRRSAGSPGYALAGASGRLVSPGSWACRPPQCMPCLCAMA